MGKRNNLEKDPADKQRPKNNFKGKSNPRGRGKGRSQKRDNKEETYSASTNDPKWYGANPELLRDAASIPFSWSTGMPYHCAHDGDFIGNDVAYGLMNLNVSPTVGVSQDERSAINVAASAIYSYVRYANSGHANYDAPDLMMYLLAMSNVYSFVTWCQRLLGAVNLFDQRNRYLPRAIYFANHVDYDDMRDNIANFRCWLNTYITKVASLAVPATMSVFNRLAFLYSNVYIDGPTIKDQMYMLTPYRNAWYRFEIDETTSMGKLNLKNMTMQNDLATIKEIETYGEQLFDAIWSQEDFGIMSGDILKAYGDGNLVHLVPVPVDFVIAPLYDPMFLHQFKNARLVTSQYPGSISQTAGGLIRHRCYVDTSATVEERTLDLLMLEMDKVLTSDFDHPSPEVIIESTRLIPVNLRAESISGYLHTGTELPRTLDAIVYNSHGSLERWTITSTSTIRESTDSGFSELAGTAAILKAFKYAPEIFVGHYNHITEEYDVQHILDGKLTRIWDVDNYAVLSDSDTAKMHDSALLSLFAVPAIAKL